MPCDSTETARCPGRTFRLRSAATSIALLAFVAIGANPSLANDGAAHRVGGTIVFEQDENIRMLSEDLEVGFDRVRVAYEFKNTSKKAIRRTVAFPLPKWDNSGCADASETALPRFRDFTVRVDGKPVLPDYDLTVELARPGPTVRKTEKGAAAVLRYRGVTARQAQVTTIGSDIPEAEIDGCDATETSSAVFHWEQEFPPGKTVRIAHSYTPHLGMSLCLDETSIRRYGCADQKPFNLMLPERRCDDHTGGTEYLEYILRTAKTWKGPIGRFKLTVHPGRRAWAMCGPEVKPKPKSKDTWVFEARDYVPPDTLSLVRWGK